MILEYKGTSIFYETLGIGDAVVLLHGFLENSSMWDYIPGQVFEDCQIIRVDLLGHGKTGCIGYVHTMELMAEAVLTVIDKLEISKFKLVGHSMGGYVALALAKIKPELVTGVCLMNSTFQADSIERLEIRKRAIKMAKTNYESLVRMSFLNLFSTKNREIFTHEINLALKEALKTPVRGYIAAQEGMMKRPSSLDLIKSFKIKTYIILGAEDNLVDVGKIKKLSENTGITISVISGSHMSYIENNKVLSYKIKQYIEN